jgi:hypothetical protein
MRLAALLGFEAFLEKHEIFFFIRSDAFFYKRPAQN